MSQAQQLTEYLCFYYKFKNALAAGDLDRYLIYNNEAETWFKKQGFTDLEIESRTTLRRRSYPHELDLWVKEVLKYLYDSRVEKVDASIKHIPTFLLRN